MRLQVNPLSDVLLIWDLPNDKLLPEVLMVHYEGSVADHVLYLFRTTQKTKMA